MFTGLVDSRCINIKKNVSSFEKLRRQENTYKKIIIFNLKFLFQKNIIILKLVH